jgi:hypothetical protein
VTVPQAQDQFPFLKQFVNNWPLYDIVSRFLHNHSRYMQTKLSGLNVTQGGSVNSEVDKGEASDIPDDPQDEEQIEMDVEEENGMDVEGGEHDEEENEMDVKGENENENEMDVEDGEHDPQTDENVIGPQVPHRPDPDSQAAQANPPPPSHPSPSKAQSKPRPKQVQNSKPTGNTQPHEPLTPSHPGVTKAPSMAGPKSHEKRALKKGSHPDSQAAAAPSTPAPNKTQSRPRLKLVGNSKPTGIADTVSPQAPSTISPTIKIPPKHLRTKAMLENVPAHPKRAMDDAPEDTETSPPAKKSRNSYSEPEDVVCPSLNNDVKG